MPLSPDLLSANIQAQQFKQERLNKKKESPSPDALEKRSPFESAPFLLGMTRLTQKIGKKILDYHLISDDRSGRIPTLILSAWQIRAQIAAGINTTDQIRVDFLLGGHVNAQNQKGIEDFIASNQIRLQQEPNLLVTDNIDTGDSLARLLKAFDRYQIPIDIAILSHYEPLNQYNDLLRNRTIYLGERLPVSFLKLFGHAAGSAIIRRHDATGLGVNHNKPLTHPVLKAEEYRNRDMEVLVREQAIEFAAKLPLPKLR